MLFSIGQKVKITCSAIRYNVPIEIVGQKGEIIRPIQFEGNPGVQFYFVEWDGDQWCIAENCLEPYFESTTKQASELMVGDRIAPVGHTIVAVARDGLLVVCKVNAGVRSNTVFYNQFYDCTTKVKVYI